MINSIIEDSYQKKEIIKKKLPIEETEKSEIFHQMKYKNLESASLIESKVKNADVTINSNIDDLLTYAAPDSKNKTIREQFVHFNKEVIASEPIIKAKKRPEKHLFKGDFSLSDKMKKTKIREFSFLGRSKTFYEQFSKINATKNKNFKNIKKTKFKNKSMLVNIYRPESMKVEIAKKNNNLSMNNDSLFITKLPKTDFFPNKTNVIFNKFNTIKLSSKEQKLRKIQKIVKESNSHMLDIYNGLRDIKQNKVNTFNSLMFSFPQSKQSDVRTIKTVRSLRNIDKFINLHLQKNQSVVSMNKKFHTLFQKIFHNKKYSNDKFDARTIMDPLDKIAKGSYKEIKMDNLINNTLGQRIWIKKSTANIISYGKSCQKISDDIFYKERKRIISIYPKIEEEAKIIVPKRKIDKKNPLFKRLIANVNKLNEVFLEEYDLLKRVNRRMRKHKIK